MLVLIRSGGYGSRGSSRTGPPWRSPRMSARAPTWAERPPDFGLKSVPAQTRTDCPRPGWAGPGRPLANRPCLSCLASRPKSASLGRPTRMAAHRYGSNWSPDPPMWDFAGLSNMGGFSGCLLWCSALNPPRSRKPGKSQIGGSGHTGPRPQTL